MARTFAPPRGATRAPLGVRLALLAVVAAVTAIAVVPLLWMVSTAFKTGTAAYADPGLIPSDPTLENFRTVLTSTGQAPVLRWASNSFVVATTGALLTIVVCSLSGYAFARIPFPGRRVLFGLMISTFVLPGVMFLVPQYVLVDDLGLYNTLPALVLPGLAGVFGVFFMRQFFLGFPVELEEAASLDGAGTFRIFWQVVLPLSRPALVTLAIISFLGYWNDYLWPIVVCEGSGCTLPAGLRNFQGQRSAEYGLLMAGAVVASLPMLVVFTVAQRWIVQSVAQAGLKS